MGDRVEGEPVSVRFVRLLTLVLWVGGLCFFAFVVAPVAFGRLASAAEAGVIVGGTLRVLHLLGLGCGVVFLSLTLVFAGRGARRPQVECLLVGVMLLVTAYSQFRVLPAMEVDRAAAGGDVVRVAVTDPARVDFDRLHRLSERMEGAVLLCGLALLFAVAGEGGRGRRLKS